MATVSLASADVIVVNTKYMLAMTLWGFSQPRKPAQRLAAGTYLAQLVHTLCHLYPFGLQLHIPGLVAPLNVDQQGCLDQPSWHSLITPGCQGPEATCHPEVATYIVLALSPENQYPEFWQSRGIHLLSQLANLINFETSYLDKPVAQRVSEVPAVTPPASPAITSASAAYPPSDEDSDNWYETLPSVAAFMAVLSEPAADQSHL